jgi:hypothetical protein
MCSTSLTPKPKGSAPTAPCVEVWLVHDRQLAVTSGNGVVHDRQRQVRPPNLAARGLKARECLCADIVDNVPVDIDQAGKLRILVHDVLVPDFLVECFRCHDCGPL